MLLFVSETSCAAFELLNQSVALLMYAAIKYAHRPFLIGGRCSLVQGFIFGHGFQICFRTAVQDQFCIGLRVVVNQVVQFGALIHIVSFNLFDLGAVNGQDATGQSAILQRSRYPYRSSK